MSFHKMAEDIKMMLDEYKIREKKRKSKAKTKKKVKGKPKKR